MHHFKSPEQGAATTVWAALSPHFEDAEKHGGECGEVHPEYSMWDTASAPHAYDEAGEERLWDISCEAVGVPMD
jgi:hypothetical protein